MTFPDLRVVGVVARVGLVTCGGCGAPSAPAGDAAPELDARWIGGPTLSHEPLASGARAWLAVDGAAAFDDVVFVAGTGLGAACPAALGGVCLGVSAPTVLGRARADAAGHAALRWRVPGSAAGETLALQGAIPRGVGGVDSVVTAVVQAEVDGLDADADGYDAGSDCDDNDANVHPGAGEACDGVDTDCDPATSEDGLVSIGAVTYGSVGDALWVAAPGATVAVCAGTWSEALVAERPVHLVGVAGAARTTIDAGGTALPALSVEGAGSTTVERLTLTGGAPGIAIGDGVALTVRHAVIRDNTNPAGGGGIAGQVSGADPPIVVLDDVELAGNHSDTYGGGLYLWHGDLTATGVVFRGNSAGIDGGGAHLTWGTAALSGGAFYANTSATGVGGGLALSSIEADVVVTDTDFGAGVDDNVADDVYVLASGDRYTWFAAGASFTCLAASPYSCQ